MNTFNGLSDGEHEVSAYWEPPENKSQRNGCPETPTVVTWREPSNYEAWMSAGVGVRVV